VFGGGVTRMGDVRVNCLNKKNLQKKLGGERRGHVKGGGEGYRGYTICDLSQKERRWNKTLQRGTPSS